jgi:hypothetical protein
MLIRSDIDRRSKDGHDVGSLQKSCLVTFVLNKRQVLFIFIWNYGMMRRARQGSLLMEDK